MEIPSFTKTLWFRIITIISGILIFLINAADLDQIIITPVQERGPIVSWIIDAINFLFSVVTSDYFVGFIISLVLLAVYNFPSVTRWFDKRATNKTNVATKILNPQHLNNSVIVNSYEVGKKKLSGPTQFVEIKINIFNGSGVRISLGDKVVGKAKMRAPLKENIELLPSEFINHIRYPGYGSFTLRQILSADEISEEKAHAESPSVRQLDSIFGDGNAPPSLLLTLSEVKVSATADSVDFNINLPDHIEIPY